MEKTEYIPGEASPKRSEASSAVSEPGAADKEPGVTAETGSTASNTDAVPAKASGTVPVTDSAAADENSTELKTGGAPADAKDTKPKIDAAPAKADNTAAATTAAPAKVSDITPETNTVPAKASDAVPAAGTVIAKESGSVPTTGAVTAKDSGAVPTTGAVTAKDNGAVPAKSSDAAQKPSAAPVKPATAPKPQEHLSDSVVMKRTAGVWRYREITDDGTEMHSEAHSKHTRTDFADIIAARVRGKKHKHEGTNCDDYFETAVTDDCIICVVCDGAGSRKLSRIGSRVCCETAASYLKKELSALFAEDAGLKKRLSADMTAPEFLEGCGKIASFVRGSAITAYNALESTYNTLKGDEKYTNALGRAVQIGDLAATFLAAVIVPLVIDGKRQALTVSVQIGDGCICTIDTKADADSCFRLMCEADSGAFSGETDFISAKNIRPEVLGAKTRAARNTADIIMLMTDGVADDYFPAQPMMKRLYLDLCLNGILPMNGELTCAEDPPPVFYSSVSMGRRSVALQYAKQLLSDGGRQEMDGLWDKRDMLRCHSLEAYRMSIGDTPEERLCEWLDNYNERGSFDDRTLAVIRLSDLEAKSGD